MESKNKGEPDTAFIGLLDSNLEIELKKGNYFQLEYNGKKIGKDKYYYRSNKIIRKASVTQNKTNYCYSKWVSLSKIQCPLFIYVFTTSAADDQEYCRKIA